jgi:hypothetical protein
MEIALQKNEIRENGRELRQKEIEFYQKVSEFRKSRPAPKD